MRAWTQASGKRPRCKRQGSIALVFGSLLFGLLAGAAPGLASAESERPDQVQATPHAVAVVTVVRARDLMSATDRLTYRAQIRAASTAEARRRVQTEWLDRLQARAVEHGVVMVVETRVLRPEGRQGETARLPPRAP